MEKEKEKNYNVDYAKEYYNKNKERILKYQKKYYEENNSYRKKRQIKRQFSVKKDNFIINFI